MRVCEFCGKELPNEESFCGYCGRTTHNSPETPASSSGLPTVKQTAVDAANTISALDWEWEDAVAFHSSPTISVHRYAPPSAPPHAPAYPPAIHLPHRPPNYTPAGGCAPAWLIFLFAAIFIISSLIGIGLTVVSPSLSLSGGTNVALGDSLHLHGSGFIPISGVVLTLDDTTPLYFTGGSSTMQAFYGTHTPCHPERSEGSHCRSTMQAFYGTHTAANLQMLTAPLGQIS